MLIEQSLIISLIWLELSMVSLLGTILLIEPLIALFIAFLYALGRVKITHSPAANKQTGGAEKLFHLRCIQEAGYMAPLPRPPRHLHQTDESPYLYLLQHRIQKEVQKRNIKMPSILKEKAHILVVGIIVVSIPIQFMASIPACYSQSNFIRQKFKIVEGSDPSKLKLHTLGKITAYIETTVMEALRSLTRVPIYFEDRDLITKKFAYTARIRQIRVQQPRDDCKFAHDYGTALKPRCTVYEDMQVEETRHFLPDWVPATGDECSNPEADILWWKMAYCYHNGTQADNMLPFPSGGYWYNIPQDPSQYFIRSQTKLYQRGWLNNYTRTVVVEVTLVNLDTSMASSVFVQFHLMGGRLSWDGVVYCHPVIISFYGETGLEFLLALFIFTFLKDIIGQVSAIYKHGLIHHFTSILSILETLRLLLSFVFSAANIHHSNVRTETMRNLTIVLKDYSSHQRNHTNMNEVLVTFTTILVSGSVLVYTMAMIMLLKGRDITRLKVFFSMIFIAPVLLLSPLVMMMTFAMVGFLSFQSGKYEFSQFKLSYFETIQQIIRPVSRLKDLQAVQPVMGPVFSIGLYLLLTLFIYNTFIIFFQDFYWYYKDRNRRERFTKARNFTMKEFLKHYLSQFKKHADVKHDPETIDADIVLPPFGETWHLMKTLNSGVRKVYTDKETIPILYPKT